MRRVINFFLELPIMNKLTKKFPFLNKLMNYETISYLIFGVLTTVVCIAGYCVIIWLLSGGTEPTRLQVNAANILSWILAVIFAYVTNKLWVFNSVSTEPAVLAKEITAFFGARLFSLGFELVWMNTFITLFGARYNTIYKIGAQVGIVIMNYVFSKLFIFKSSSKEN